MVLWSMLARLVSWDLAILSILVLLSYVSYVHGSSSVRVYANYSRCPAQDFARVAVEKELVYLRSSNGICDQELRHIDAIVILGQLKHSSYDSSHSTSLEPILSSLQYFYPQVRNADVLLWHEGEITQKHLPRDLGFPVILCNLSASGAWGLPKHGLSDKQKQKNEELMGKAKFAMGYLYMIRFYAVTIWPLLDSMGYKYMMRFDDDSLILSCIKHNIFSTLRASNALYGFRQYSYECGFRNYFGKFVDCYCDEQGISLEELGLGSNGYCDGLGSMGYYNNFYVSKVDWWLSPQVGHFVEAFDKSNRIFTFRDNDLIFQTAAVRLFMNATDRYHFTDFSYLHHTIRYGVVLWGGVETGTADEKSDELIEEYKQVLLLKICNCTLI
jgi:hypothetical protein